MELRKGFLRTGFLLAGLVGEGRACSLAGDSDPGQKPRAISRWNRPWFRERAPLSAGTLRGARRGARLWSGSTSAIAGPVIRVFAASLSGHYRRNNVGTNVDGVRGTGTKSVLPRKESWRGRERRVRSSKESLAFFSPSLSVIRGPPPSAPSSVITLMIPWSLSSVNRPLFRVCPPPLHRLPIPLASWQADLARNIGDQTERKQKNVGW